MGEGFEQGQLAAGAAPALVAAGPAMHQGLERHARGHGGQPFGQARPEAGGQVAVAFEAAQGLQGLAQAQPLLGGTALQALIEQGQGRRQAGWVSAHQQLASIDRTMEGHGDLQLGRDHQQHRIGAIASAER